MIEQFQVTRTSRLIPDSRGILKIWEHPEQGVKYCIGSDCAEGIEHGDWSVSEVIRMDTCDQVAEMRGKPDADTWGEKSAILAEYYNTAVLAFETFPSAHGATSFRSAQDFGYSNLYYRQALDTSRQQYVDKIGWRTDAASTAQMVDRIRVALQGEGKIYSRQLLEELLGIRFERKKDGGMRQAGTSAWRTVTRTHDDCMIAYGIALCVRDALYFEGRVDEQTETRKSGSLLQMAAWKDAEKREKMGLHGKRKIRGIYEGI